MAQLASQLAAAIKKAGGRVDINSAPIVSS